jgi:hypothetical protein
MKQTREAVCAVKQFISLDVYDHYTVDLLFDWFKINCLTTDLFLFAKQTNPNQSSRRSMVQ